MYRPFRPDFCEAADPESKGLVENLVGYAKADLVIPGAPFPDLAAANAAAVAWCAEVNGRVHSETSAVPAERLAVERSLLRPLPSLRPAPGVRGPFASRQIAGSRLRCPLAGGSDARPTSRPPGPRRATGGQEEIEMNTRSGGVGIIGVIVIVVIVLLVLGVIKL